MLPSDLTIVRTESVLDWELQERVNPCSPSPKAGPDGGRLANTEERLATHPSQAIKGEGCDQEGCPCVSSVPSLERTPVLSGGKRAGTGLIMPISASNSIRIRKILAKKTRRISATLIVQIPMLLTETTLEIEVFLSTSACQVESPEQSWNTRYLGTLDMSRYSYS